jgi:SAM-dependent methyltransferase
MDDYARRNAQAYDEHAGDWDASMPRNIAHKYIEKPAMAALLPSDLQFKDVLCIGVGAGDELADIITRNPRRVVGIDTSQKLLDIARAKYPSIETQRMDMMELAFPDASFDLVYSSLAFHYANDWDVLMAGVYRVLRPGGSLLFSTHHPDYWGTKDATGIEHTNARGIVLKEHTASLPGKVDIIYYNHPSVDSLLESVTHAGFHVTHHGAPQLLPARGRLSPPEQEKYDSLAEKNTSTPLFLIVAATK